MEYMINLEKINHTSNEKQSAEQPADSIEQVQSTELTKPELPVEATQSAQLEDSTQQGEKAETIKKVNYSQTPQPSLKNVSNDMVKLIETEINHIPEKKKETKKLRTYFFGVYI